MHRKSRKILSKAVEKAAQSGKGLFSYFPAFDISAEAVKEQMPIDVLKAEETPKDKLFRLIYLESIKGYSFTDESGQPWIRKSDIEESCEGLYIIRFRCPLQSTKEAHFGCLSKAVCAAMESTLNFFHETREEFGLPYEQCVWVLQKGSLNSEVSQNVPEREESPDDFPELEESLDDFSDEEIKVMIEAAEENFV